jgi:hypothetical protein
MKRLLGSSTRCVRFVQRSTPIIAQPRRFATQEFQKREKVDFTEQVSLFTGQLFAFNEEQSNKLAAYLESQEDLDNNLDIGSIDTGKKVSPQKIDQLVKMIMEKEGYANPMVSANFLLQVVQFYQIERERQDAKYRAENGLIGEINQERKSDISEDPAMRKLLTHSWTLIEPFLKKENESVLSLALQISAKLKTDRDILSTCFASYMNYFYAKYEQQKLNIDTVVLAFCVAPHIGKFNEMMLLGNYIENSPQEEGAPPLLDLIHETALMNNSFDYSSIFDLLSRDRNEEILNKQHQIQYTGPVLYETYRVQNVRIRPIEEDENLSEPVDEEENVFRNKYETEDWIQFDHDMPNMIQWGDCILWYQLNGGILLSGISSPIEKQDEMKELIQLYGYAEYEQLTAQEQKDIIEQYGVQDDYRIEVEGEDKEQVEKILKEGQEEIDKHDFSFLVESQFEIEHDMDTRYVGKYTRTLTSMKEDELIFEKKVYFDIVMEIQRIADK